MLVNRNDKVFEVSNATIPSNPDANLPLQEVAAIQTASATFQTNNGKLYVSVVTCLWIISSF